MNNGKQIYVMHLFYVYVREREKKKQGETCPQKLAFICVRALCVGCVNMLCMSVCAFTCLSQIYRRQLQSHFPVSTGSHDQVARVRSASYDDL